MVKLTNVQNMADYSEAMLGLANAIANEEVSLKKANGITTTAKEYRAGKGLQLTALERAGKPLDTESHLGKIMLGDPTHVAKDKTKATKVTPSPKLDSARTTAAKADHAVTGSAVKVAKATDKAEEVAGEHRLLIGADLERKA